MQSAMERFECYGALNLSLMENNTYLRFDSKAKILYAYRKILQKQKEALKSS
jgi:hypothetical protein